MDKAVLVFTFLNQKILEDNPKDIQISPMGVGCGSLDAVNYAFQFANLFKRWNSYSPNILRLGQSSWGILFNTYITLLENSRRLAVEYS